MLFNGPVLVRAQHRHAGEFGVVIADDYLRPGLALHDQGVEFPHPALVRERSVDHQGQALVTCPR